MSTTTAFEAIKGIFTSAYERGRWLEFLSKDLNQAINVLSEPIAKQVGDDAEAYEIAQITLQPPTPRGMTETMPVVEIKVRNRQIQRNRVELNRLARKAYQKNDTGSMLVIFYDEDTSSREWRFSFLTVEGIMGEVKSDPKRYTYVLGSDETHKTITERFELLKNIGKIASRLDYEEAFSVEKISKSFFDGYKRKYELLTEDLSQTGYIFFGLETAPKNKSTEAKPIRDFVKQLMGRLVFLQFLQKKRWLGCSATTRDWTDGDTKFLKTLAACAIKSEKKSDTNFYAEYLYPLFFETLNQKRHNDAYTAPGIAPCRVPYLNGGLFEAKEYETNKDIPVSNTLLFEVLDFFDKYNFTIDESSPNDHEVGVDPEMLGHIFENLLDENQNRINGAYYTPKEIVQYMCQESLIEYLQESINNLDREIISDLVKNHHFHPKNKSHATALNTALKNVRIVDPAIGSGAFPIGMLHEILRCRIELLSKLPPNEAEWNNFEIKKGIIQDCIYGVDLDEGAIEIARLRFWLSLIVDSTTPAPLPNLDFKIMQGNSLIDNYKGYELNSNKSKELLFNEQEAELNKLIDNYFNEQGEGKEMTKKKINNMLLENYAKKLNYEINNTTKELEEHENNLKIASKTLVSKSKGVASKTEIKVNEIKSLIKENQNKITQLSKERDEVMELYKKNSQPFFLWKTWFRNVFVEKKGFDIVIGNPPYIKEAVDKKIFETLKDHPYYIGKMDIWYAFACISLDLLRNGGIHSFIAQNNWTTSAGASKLRNKITSESEILHYCDFGDYKIFDNASIQTMIYVIKKTNPRHTYFSRYQRLNSRNKNSKTLEAFFSKEESIGVYFESKMDSDLLKDGNIYFDSPLETEILTKMFTSKNYSITNKNLSQGIVAPQEDLTLKNAIKIGQLNLANTGIFILNDTEVESLSLNSNEKKLLLPYCTSTDLMKYSGVSKFSKYVIYTDSSFKNLEKIKPYPNIKKHLDQFHEILTSDNKPYGLHRSRRRYFFSGPRLISQRQSTYPKFTYVDITFCVSQSFNIIKDKNIDLRYLCILLNSKVIAYWLYKRGKLKGDTFQIDTKPLMDIPLIISSLPEKLNNSIAENFDNLRIDEIIDFDDYFFKIYNLNNVEIKHIERWWAALFSEEAMKQIDSLIEIDIDRAKYLKSRWFGIEYKNKKHVWFAEISRGESKIQEFKSTLSWDLNLNQKNNELELATLKTLAAFANTQGGVLFIGVADDGTVLGIQNDLIHLKTVDGFKKHLDNIIEAKLGNAFHASIEKDIEIEEILPGCTVARIAVSASNVPVYVNSAKNTQDYYIRRFASSVKLVGDELEKYIKSKRT